MILSLLLVGCKSNEVNQSPTCIITSPQNNAQFNINESIMVTVVAEDSDGTIAEVRLYINNVEHSVKTEFPYNFTINAGELSAGSHTLKAVAKDNLSATAEATVSITINAIRYTVGERALGGIIAYVDNTGYHGFVAAPEDLSTGIRWYNGTDITTGANGYAIGTGKTNTEKIVEIQGDGNYAAKLCYDLVLNGYDDWFLPSSSELLKLWDNKALIGGFTSGWYWSSSEGLDWLSSSSALCRTFGNPSQSATHVKYMTYRVRAIRYF